MKAPLSGISLFIAKGANHEIDESEVLKRCGFVIAMRYNSPFPALVNRSDKTLLSAIALAATGMFWLCPDPNFAAVAHHVTA
jgi:hypothetical protein